MLSTLEIALLNLETVYGFDESSLKDDIGFIPSCRILESHLLTPITMRVTMVGTMIDHHSGY
jgi:hypothetical protein